MAILFGCHGNIKFQKKSFLNGNSSKTIKLYDSNLVQMLLEKGQFRVAKSLPMWLMVYLPWQQKAPIDFIMGNG